MSKRYNVRVREDYRWRKARVSGREFTKDVEVLSEQFINDEMRASPLLVIEPLNPEPVQVDATDAARELAEENGIELWALVPGSGEEGRLLVSDVREVIDGSG